MSQSTIVHDTFTVERTYPAAVARVFNAFADPAIKRHWFADGENEDWVTDEYTVDFREGGLETGRFRYKGGPIITNDTLYLDIVSEQRIVFSYVMTVGGKRISASLASVEFFSTSNGTRLVYTEQGQFFDSADQPSGRKEGCEGLFDRLGQELAGTN